ncbi:MAG TPA: NAD(+)/NADH kinase [Polyangiaceae bacterium]|nr:NAD(+)/NADH kinase [Polyangiaceae bacterium]
MSDVLVVAKRTAYAQHALERKDPDALRLLAAGDPSVARWKKAHDDHERTLGCVLQALAKAGITPMVVPARTAFDATGVHLVVTVGGDGTLLSASHHVGECPILGVNSSPTHSIGFFCAATAESIDTMLRQALDESLPSVRLSRMQVMIDDELCSKRVLNEALFCHTVPAATSRYILEFGGDSEDQRSSGVWVSTAAGSTAALRSAGGDVLPFASPDLQLVVREPYSMTGTDYRLRKCSIKPGQEIVLRSKMVDARLFLDGPYAAFEVGLGQVLRFSRSDEPLHLLGLTDRR